MHTLRRWRFESPQRSGLVARAARPFIDHSRFSLPRARVWQQTIT